MKRIFRHSFLILSAFIIFAPVYTFAKPAHASDHYHDKCATFWEPEKKRALMVKLTGSLSAQRPQLSDYYDTPDGNFRIHYTTVGINAVDPADNNNNGLPDYIDSVAFHFMNVYQVEVVELGFLSPIDDMGGGSSDAYDVYLMEIGMDESDTGFEGIYGVTMYDREIQPRKIWPRWTSFIIMDNNYSEDDYFTDGGYQYKTYFTTGIDGMKVTAAHEFHHAIQARYGTTTQSTGLLNEMTSVWFEYRVYPEVKDFFQYLPYLFANLDDFPFGGGRTSLGYAWGIFLQYVHKNFGDEAVLEFWQYVGEGNYGYEALDMALKSHESTLDIAWCDFMSWMYYTGHNYSLVSEGQRFDDARLFPNLKFHTTQYYTSEPIESIGNLDAYQARSFRYILPAGSEETNDTLDLIITSTDHEAAFLQFDRESPYSININKGETTGYDKIPHTSYYYKLYNENGTICDRQFIMAGSDALNVYPNPFIPGDHSAIYFPVEAALNEYDEVILSIYNTEMLGIFSKKLEVENHLNNKVVILKDIPFEFTSGVYIYSLKYNDKDHLGKFMVKRIK